MSEASTFEQTGWQVSYWSIHEQSWFVGHFDRKEEAEEFMVTARQMDGWVDPKLEPAGKLVGSADA